MKVFFTDLDNTLIYSHRKNIEKEKIAVEYLNGKQQSYMTNYTYNYLKTADWLDVVPVTTRTFSQFQRLTFVDELLIKRAIVCNGGMLLHDNVEDEEWSAETLMVTEKRIESLNTLAEMLRNDYPEEPIHRPTPYMLYMKCAFPGEMYKRLAIYVNGMDVTVHHDQRKVYFFCRGVDKGNAALRYANRIKDEIDVAAGDDVMDIPMLNLARFAFASKRIAPFVKNENLIIFDGEMISDSICDELQRLHNLGAI